MFRFYFFIILLPLLSFSQNKHHISGKVIDENTLKALEFVEVIARSSIDSLSIYGTITDSDGIFELHVPTGRYYVNISCIAYDSISMETEVIENKNLGQFKLKNAPEQLNEVTIESEKSIIAFEPDKKVYNISKDATSVGTDISEVLGNLPSVSVDPEGSVSIRGDENIRILIDGKPSPLVNSAPENALTQLSTDIVEKVEVITNPSAKYDASGTGGVLNIILKKSKVKGQSGTLNLSIGAPTLSNASANLNYRTSKYSLNTNIASFYTGRPGSLTFENTYENTTLTRTHEQRDIDREDIAGTINTSIDYYLNPKTTLKASALGRIADENDNFINTSLGFSDTTLVNSQLIKNPQQEWDRGIQLDLGIDHKFTKQGKSLSANLQYVYDKEDVNQTATTFENLDTEELLSEELVNSIKYEQNLLGQIDYVYEKEDLKFESGYRTTLTSNNKDYQLDDLDLNTLTYVPNQDLTNTFDYRTHINAVYTQYQNCWGKVSATMGLRLEYTELKGEINTPFDTSGLQNLIGEVIQLNFKDTYLAPFPTLNMSYDYSKDTQVSIAINRRIRRPYRFFLNPFPSRSSQTNIFQGNPNLLPVFSTNYEIAATHKWNTLNINASLYYQHAPNYFHVVHETIDNAFTNGVPVIRAIPINLEKSERRGVELNIIYTPWHWWRINLGLNGYFFEYTGDYNGVNFDSIDNALKTNFSSKVKLPWKINWQTNFNYTAGRRTAQTFYNPRYRLDLVFSKEFIKQNLSCSFRITDMFNTYRRRFKTTGTDFTTEGDLLFRKRQFALSLIYKINPEQYKRNQVRKVGFSESSGAGY